MSRRSGWRGLNRLRKVLRKVPQETTKEVREAIVEGAKAVERDAKAAAPVSTGTLRKYITAKASRDELSAKIGLRTKTAKRKAFYAHFVEFGTRGALGRFEGGDRPPQPARPFLFPAIKKNKDNISKKVLKGIRKALLKASSGTKS